MNVTQTIEELVERLDRSVTGITRRAAIRRLYRRLATVAGTEVERSSYLVLKQLVADGPTRITDLAHEHGVEPSTMSRHTSGLEESGLVVKRADPSDRRVALAEATGKGASVVEKVEAERHRIFTVILSRWDPADAARFVDLIERFDADVTDLLQQP